jgi:hypothetical protein
LDVAGRGMPPGTKNQSGRVESSVAAMSDPL